MWGPLAGQAAAQLDAPSAASSLAAAALWEHAPAWAGAALGPQHQAQLSPGAQRALEQGQGLAWPNPGQEPPAAHHTAHSAAAKIYVQGLPHNLQHPVAVAGLFTPFGDVLDVKLYAAEVRLSGGSAVVRMRSMSQAASAIAALNGVVPDGGWQQLTVRAAETAEQRSNRITAINGRQSGGSIGGLGLLPTLSPTGAAALPPTGPAAASAALRRVHSARGAGSQGSLHCYTGALVGEGGVPGGTPRAAAEWGGALAGRDASMDSRRSSMDALRPASAAFARSSSDSGSGGEACDEGADAGGPPAAEAQRMLLEAVLALLAQVEAGQLSLGAMRGALEAALTAAKAGLGAATPSAPDGQALAQGRASNGHSPTAVGRA